MINVFQNQETVSRISSSVFCILLFAFCFAFSARAATPDPNAKREAEAIKAFQAAEDLQVEGKMQEALSAYERILEKYPETTLKKDIIIKMAQCHTRLGDDDSAIQTYLRLISDDPDTIEASQAVSLMMNLYFQRYRFDEVMAMSRHLIQQFPGTETAAMAVYRAAGYLYTQGEFQKAIQEYESFMDGFPKSIMRSTAFNRLISLYIREGMFKEAERRLMDKLGHDPNDTYMLRQLALVYQKQGDYDRALDLYRQILNATPGDVEIYEQLGELYAERGDEEKAIAEWSKITGSAPGQYSRHQMLAHILKSHGFYDRAVEEYRKAIELQPQIYYLYTQLADVYIIKKQFDSAMDVYLDALIMFPINDPSRSRINTAMLELCDLEGLQDKVISRLKNHLARTPDSISALLTLAEFYFHQGNIDSSLQQFRTIASLYPDEGGILFDQAQTLERERQFDHAIRFYQAVLDLFPQSDISLQALIHIGELRSRIHQPQAAISVLRILLSRLNSEEGSDENPLWLDAHILIGDIYLQQMHDVETALSTYTEARDRILAKPDRMEYLSIERSELDLRITECYRLMGRYDEAENVLNSMQITYQSRSIAVQIAKLRGDCYFSRGDFDSALSQYKEATEWLMNEDWVNDALDRTALIKEYSDHGLRSMLDVHAQVERLRKLGKYSEALELCESAVREYGTDAPMDRIQLEIGDLLALQMKAMEAISAYERLIQSQSPLAPEAQFQIAGVYWQQLKDAKQAIGGYSALIEKYPDSVLVGDARKRIRQLAESASVDNLP